MASMRELAMDLLSRAGTGPIQQPVNVYGQDPDLPIGYGEGDVMSPIDAAAMSTMFVPVRYRSCLLRLRSGKGSRLTTAHLMTLIGSALSR